MVVSWNGGTPIIGWLVYSGRSIYNSWFRGPKKIGNLHPWRRSQSRVWIGNHVGQSENHGSPFWKEVSTGKLDKFGGFPTNHLRFFSGDGRINPFRRWVRTLADPFLGSEWWTQDVNFRDHSGRTAMEIRPFRLPPSTIHHPPSDFFTHHVFAVFHYTG